MFVSFDAGVRWQSLQLNLPVTPVTDIKIVNKDLVLSTMGRSFLDFVRPHAAAGAIGERGVGCGAPLPGAGFLSVVRRAEVRGARRRPTSRSIRRRVPTSTITWRPSRPVRCGWKCSTSRGGSSGAFSSETAGEETELPDTVRMGDWHLEDVGTARLPKSAGMHRFTWDLRHAGPWSASAQQSGRNGPIVRPGTYQARLWVGNRSQTVSFEALMDPRIDDEGLVTRANVDAQVELSLDVRDALSDARLAAAKLDEAREGSAGDVARALDEIREQLVTASRRYSQPMIVDQLSYLYSNLTRADQQPGQDAFDRYQELNSMLSDHIGRLEQLLRTGSSADRQ